jgi:hypothetical protein
MIVYSLDGIQVDLSGNKHVQDVFHNRFRKNECENITKTE